MEFTITGYHNAADVPKWVNEVVSVIAADYEQKAIKYDNELRAAIAAAVSTAEPGYAGIAVQDLMNAAGRFDYRIGVEINGRKLDIGVDLLLHTVTIYESK